MVLSKSMDNAPTQSTEAQNALKTRKRKKKTKSSVEPKSMKVEASTPAVLKPNIQDPLTKEQPKEMINEDLLEKFGERFPVLKNELLVKKFLSVSLTNNQKGRIRQVLRDNLKGTADILLPDVIHNRIQTVLRSSGDLTETDLRKIRILYNMLKTSLEAEHKASNTPPEKKIKKKKQSNMEGLEVKEKKIKKKKDPSEKVEPPVKKERKKRYVVFLGNLPLDVNKDKIISHFSEMNEHITDIRIPKLKEGKKSAIAYAELRNEPTYELALSKHHSMMGSKRINVLYTTQKNGKITKGEAKSKSAKLIALQKSGKLIGSTAMVKKRSHRRAKLRQARAREAANT